MIARPLGGRDVAAGALLLALITGFLAASHPLLAFAAFFGIVFLTWVIGRAELVLMVMVAALPWEAMLHYPSTTFSTVKLLGMALVAAYAFSAVSGKTKLRTSPVLWIALLFGLVVGLSLLASPEPSAGLVKGFRYAFFVLFLILVAQLVTDIDTGKRLLRVYCASAALAGLVGLSSFLAGATGRAAGPIEDPNDFGYLMATVVPLGAYLYVEDRKLRPLWAAALVLLLAAGAATLSRGALVGLGALVLWAVLSGRIGVRALILAGAGALAVGIVAFTLWSPIINERLEEKNHIAAKNVESREAFWSAAVRMWMDNPALGVGPARFGLEAPEYVRSNPIALRDPVVHNAYLELLAEDGPLAIGLFLLMLIVSWVLLTQGEREARRRDRTDALRFAAAVKGTLIVAAVSAAFLSEQIAAPIWLACALAASGAVLRRGTTTAEPRQAVAPAAT